MVSIAEVEKLALNLPELERAHLAAHLLDSLPPCCTMMMTAWPKRCSAMLS